MGTTRHESTEHEERGDVRVPRMMTMPEVADVLGVSVRTVIRAINCGDLVATRIRRSTRIAVSDLRNYLDTRRDLSPRARSWSRAPVMPRAARRS